MSDSWIRETMELVEELQGQLDKVEGKLSGLLNEREELERQIEATQNLIRLYRNKHQALPASIQDIRVGHFEDKSYPEMLKEIASKLGGYFKVLDATEIMLQAGVNNDRRTIQANIYAALRRDKKHFVKIKDGEYRYTNGPPGQDIKPGREPAKSRSGVQAAIKKLKDENPQLTKKEVLNRLIEANFDFKGRRPVNAVNIVWAKLGYHKEGKQQGLPEAT